MKQKLPLEDLKLKQNDFEIAAPAPTNENILRPKKLNEYIGQEAAKGKLEVFMAAARKRKAVLDHVLLSGPPGLGKTTLAHIVAQEMQGQLHVTSGPTLERPVDLVAILSTLQNGDVLFIDEIHRLPAVVEESLYPAMEDFSLQVILGEGAAAQSVSLPLQKFTLVGATTQVGKLTAPLRDRFGIHLNLDFYNNNEMEQILNRSAGILKMNLSPQEIKTVATRSRGTPRIANRLLARVNDYIEVKGPNSKSKTIAQEALEFLEVDDFGLQPLDRQYLQVLLKNFKGGPAGVEAIAASMSESKSTLEETVEPFLLMKGFVLRTSKGRIATETAYQHMGLPVVKNSELNLL